MEGKLVYGNQEFNVKVLDTTVSPFKLDGLLKTGFVEDILGSTIAYKFFVTYKSPDDKSVNKTFVLDPPSMNVLRRLEDSLGSAIANKKTYETVYAGSDTTIVQTLAEDGSCIFAFISNPDEADFYVERNRKIFDYSKLNNYPMVLVSEKDFLSIFKK